MGPQLRRNGTTFAIVGLLATASQSVLLAGCGGSSLPAGPIITTVPSSWDYTTDPQEFAVFVGTPLVMFSAQIQDEGTLPLVIRPGDAGITLNDTTGAFQLVPGYPAGFTDNDAGVKLTIDSTPDSASVQVLFTPTQAAIYEASITIVSNAVNDGGVATINIRALGVLIDGGIPADAGVLEDAGLYVDAGGGSGGGSGSGGCATGGGAPSGVLVFLVVGLAIFGVRRRQSSV